MPKRKAIKICLGLLGIALVIIGWLFGNLSRIPCARNLLLPSYTIALRTLEKMNKEGFVLKNGDKGFSEIADVLKKDIKTMITEEGHTMPPDLDALKKLPVWRINRFETLKSEIGMGPNDIMTRRLTLRISSDNAPTIDLPIADMKSLFENRYRDDVVFSWGKYVFGVGVLISVIGVFL